MFIFFFYTSSTFYSTIVFFWVIPGFPRPINWLKEFLKSYYVSFFSSIFFSCFSDSGLINWGKDSFKGALGGIISFFSSIFYSWTGLISILFFCSSILVLYGFISILFSKTKFFSTSFLIITGAAVVYYFCKKGLFYKLETLFFCLSNSFSFSFYNFYSSIFYSNGFNFFSVC